MPARMIRLTPRESAVLRDRVVRRTIELRRPNPLLTQTERENDATLALVGEVLARHAHLREAEGIVGGP